jgi:hypothetical protein
LELFGTISFLSFALGTKTPCFFTGFLDETKCASKKTSSDEQLGEAYMFKSDSVVTSIKARPDNSASR